MHTYLSGTLEKIEHGMAVVVLTDGQKLTVPKDQLQPLPSVGSSMSIKVAPAEEAELEKEALAKTLLNQILGNNA